MIFLSIDIDFYNIEIIFILLSFYFHRTFIVNRRNKANIMIYKRFINFIDNFKILICMIKLKK